MPTEQVYFTKTNTKIHEDGLQNLIGAFFIIFWFTGQKQKTKKGGKSGFPWQRLWNSFSAQILTGLYTFPVNVRWPAAKLYTPGHPCSILIHPWWPF